MQTITITLTVDTNELDQNNLSNSCSFQAVYSASGKIEYSSADLEDFTIYAEVGDIIKWQGKGANITDIIDIRWIKKYKYSTSEIFDKRPQRRNGRGRYGNDTVESNVLYETTGKPDYKYAIKFIFKGQNYFIDPKIKVGNHNIGIGKPK